MPVLPSRVKPWDEPVDWKNLSRLSSENGLLPRSCASPLLNSELSESSLGPLKQRLVSRGPASVRFDIGKSEYLEAAPFIRPVVQIQPVGRREFTSHLGLESALKQFDAVSEGYAVSVLARDEPLDDSEASWLIRNAFSEWRGSTEKLLEESAEQSMIIRDLEHRLGRQESKTVVNGFESRDSSLVLRSDQNVAGNGTLERLEKRYQQQIEELKKSQNADHSHLEKELEELQDKYDSDTQSMKRSFEEKLREADDGRREGREKHRSEIQDLMFKHQNEMADLRSKHETEILEIKKTYEERLRLAESRHDDMHQTSTGNMMKLEGKYKDELSNQKQSYEVKLKGAQKEMDNMKTSYEAKLKRADAKLKELQAKLGTDDDLRKVEEERIKAMKLCVNTAGLALASGKGRASQKATLTVCFHTWARDAHKSLLERKHVIHLSEAEKKHQVLREKWSSVGVALAGGNSRANLGLYFHAWDRVAERIRTERIHEQRVNEIEVFHSAHVNQLDKEKAREDQEWKAKLRQVEEEQRYVMDAIAEEQRLVSRERVNKAAFALIGGSVRGTLISVIQAWSHTIHRLAYERELDAQLQAVEKHKADLTMDHEEHLKKLAADRAELEKEHDKKLAELAQEEELKRQAHESEVYKLQDDLDSKIRQHEDEKIRQIRDHQEENMRRIQEHEEEKMRLLMEHDSERENLLKKANALALMQRAAIGDAADSVASEHQKSLIKMEVFVAWAQLVKHLRWEALKEQVANQHLSTEEWSVRLQQVEAMWFEKLTVADEKYAQLQMEYESKCVRVQKETEDRHVKLQTETLKEAEDKCTKLQKELQAQRESFAEMQRELPAQKERYAALQKQHEREMKVWKATEEDLREKIFQAIERKRDMPDSKLRFAEAICGGTEGQSIAEVFSTCLEQNIRSGVGSIIASRATSPRDRSPWSRPLSPRQYIPPEVTYAVDDTTEPGSRQVRIRLRAAGQPVNQAL